MKHVFLRGASAATIAVMAGLSGGGALAQTAAPPAPGAAAAEVQEVVATGSHIGGTPVNSALSLSVQT